MKWLKSTTSKKWTIAAGTKQFFVPGVDGSDYLVIEDSDFAEIKGQAVMASLIKNKAILVLDTEPAELKNTIPALQDANTELLSEIDKLHIEVEQLQASLDTKQKELDVANQQLVAKQKELEDLDAKASGIIEEKDKTIAKLEKKLKKDGE